MNAVSNIGIFVFNLERGGPLSFHSFQSVAWKIDDIRIDRNSSKPLIIYPLVEKLVNALITSI